MKFDKHDLLQVSGRGWSNSMQYFTFVHVIASQFSQSASMSNPVPTLFDDFEDPVPESSKKAARKIRNRKDNEEIPFCGDEVTPEPKPNAEPASKETELEFEEPEAVPETPAEPPEADILDEAIKTAALQSDYFSYIHKEMPSESVAVKRHSSIVLEGIISRKKDTPEQEKASAPEEVATETVQPGITPPEREEEDPALPEWDIEDKYYSIGEVAKLFHVNTSHIRFWTSSFNLKPRTTRKGDRLYGKMDIQQLRLIHYLVKEKKHTIKGAREKLKLQKETVNSGLLLKDALTALKEKLIEIRDQL